MNDVREFWDSVADIYEKENNDVKVYDLHYQRFIEAVKHIDASGNKSILNIWARSGGAIPFLRKLNPDINIVNCELSYNLTKLGKDRYPDENFVQTSLHEFPLPENKFDYVLSLETLEHVPDPLLFLKEVKRVLKKGGVLVMSAPPATSEYLRKFYELFFSDHGEGPHKFPASWTVKKLLSQADLKLIKHKGTIFLPVTLFGLYKLGDYLEPILQFPLTREWGIRQFYIAVNE